MDLRQACDRCHDKKLRCPRSPGSPCCSRCAKANVACVFSPPTRPFRHYEPLNHSHDRSHSHNHNHNSQGISFDWLDLMSLEQPQGQQQQQQEQGRHRQAQPPAQTLSERLASLLSALDRMLQAVPSSLDMHHVPRQHLREYADTVGTNFDLQSTLDSLLHHAQDLASLYPEAASASFNKRTTAAECDALCTVPDCIHQDRTSLHTTPLPKLDHALLNLVVACHLRLLDVMDTLAEHGRMCAFMVATLPPDYDPKFEVPEIRVGSFVAPTNTAASMLLSVLVELQTVLVTRVKDVVAMVDQLREDPRAAREAKVVHLQCEILQERAESTLGELSRFRDGLVSARLLR
ncbi:transcription factor [Trichoderma citrinoviride]|uniref:Transcription factor n=1 Tax=Trichoderma citrinoviride TaxID=58853 RepID=A0A2T4B8Z9_9HYPO|nr:transcription factor [Trichoderma citrinoviride]PTB65807.1 transcription factor [Trichoderma citrinoviride]